MEGFILWKWNNCNDSTLLFPQGLWLCLEAYCSTSFICIRTWAVSVDCELGYLFNVIKLIRKMLVEEPCMSDIVPVVDAMALHKGTIWGPKTKHVDTVDYRRAVPEPVDTLAMEAVVFMIVGMTGHWKYVLLDKCQTDVQVHLIKDCIELLHTESLNVLAVVLMELSQINIHLKC